MTVFHIDMDAFYASVEQYDNPQLKGKPVIVGGPPGSRGVVCTCSYEARVYGVRSAMSSTKAYQLCPQGVFILPRMSRYSYVSKAVMRILESYTPVFQQVSIDEAYLDMTGTTGIWGPPLEVAKNIKIRVKAETGLTLSIGIGPNRYLAKLASTHSKPDGLFQIKEERVQDFMLSLPLKNLHGVGPKTLEHLNQWGIQTVKDLQRIPLPALAAKVGQSGALFLSKAARGEEIHHFGEETKSRSLSSEMTFEEDISDQEVLEQTLLGLCQEVMFRMKDEGLVSSTLFIKLRKTDFTTLTAQTTLKRPVMSLDEFYGECRSLFLKKWLKGSTLRLMGTGFSSLAPQGQNVQEELFQDDPTLLNQKKTRVEEALNQLRKKLPHQKIIKARLLTPGTGLAPPDTPAQKDPNSPS